MNGPECSRVDDLGLYNATYRVDVPYDDPIISAIVRIESLIDGPFNLLADDLETVFAMTTHPYLTALVSLFECECSILRCADVDRHDDMLTMNYSR